MAQHYDYWLAYWQGSHALMIFSLTRRSSLPLNFARIKHAQNSLWQTFATLSGGSALILGRSFSQFCNATFLTVISLAPSYQRGDLPTSQHTRHVNPTSVKTPPTRQLRKTRWFRSWPLSEIVQRLIELFLGYLSARVPLAKYAYCFVSLPLFTPIPPS